MPQAAVGQLQHCGFATIRTMAEVSMPQAAVGQLQLTNNNHIASKAYVVSMPQAAVGQLQQETFRLQERFLQEFQCRKRQ